MAWIKRFDRDDLIKITATLVLVAAAIALFYFGRSSARVAEQQSERADEATTRATQGEKIAQNLGNTDVCEDKKAAAKAGMTSLCEAAASLAAQAEEEPLRGLDGADGADGADGRDGADGVDGEDGKDGKDGQPGADGSPGADGADGQDGAPGEPGPSGPSGPPGADGSPGADGKDAYPFHFIFEFTTVNARTFTCRVDFNASGEQSPEPAVCERSPL